MSTATRELIDVKLRPAELADNIGAAYVQKKSVAETWELLRRMALALRRKKFKSNTWEISIVPSTESLRWDNEKLDAYFVKQGIDTAKFKTAQDTGARVLVKRIAA